MDFLLGGKFYFIVANETLQAPPQEGTIVVNIGDFMMRLSNDTFQSTVHRVYNTSTEERVSMPFFFGLNFNEVCGVVPTCVDEKRPALYEPMSCGDVSSHVDKPHPRVVMLMRFIVVPTPIHIRSRRCEEEGNSEGFTGSRNGT